MKKKTKDIFFCILIPPLVLDYDNDDVIVQKTPKRWLMLFLWNVGGNKCRLAFCPMMTSQEDSVWRLRFSELSAGRKTKALLVSSLFPLMTMVPLSLFFSLRFLSNRFSYNRDFFHQHIGVNWPLLWQLNFVSLELASKGRIRIKLKTSNLNIIWEWRGDEEQDERC